MPTTGSDLHQSLTARIITAIQAGTGPWSLPWRTSGRLHRPTNIATGNRYNGVNVLALWAEAQLQHFSTSTWGTYRQWAAQGCQVRRGEKASTIVFYKPVTRERDETAQSEEASSQTRLIARASSVFNADQVDGFQPSPAPAPVKPAVINTTAEQFIAATRASITRGGERAFYNRETDQIRLPPRDSFIGSATSTATESYYSTILHELVHWTGPKQRLDRDLTGRFGSHAYAMEELVAELGAAFLCSDLQLSNEPRPDHAAYITSWLQVLKADPRAIFTAASKAAQAVDYLQADGASNAAANIVSVPC